MITRITDTTQTTDWRQELAAAFRLGTELLSYLGLDPAAMDWSADAARDFRCLVPVSFANRMRRMDPCDPLLLQVLPAAAELRARSGYIEDPLRERDVQVTPGLLQKYHGRVLLTATGACAVHCRYCFRRHYPYPAFNPARDDWRSALAAIHANRDCSEVILSGGDPLMLPDKQLAALVTRLGEIAHIERIRIHTRLPVVLPSRVTPQLLDSIRGCGKPVSLVLHVNHGNELDGTVGAAAARLRSAGAVLLNQSVLLRGINDSVERLQRLSERLFSYGILPYYVHLPDKVAGTAHFRVTVAEARRLQAGLRRLLPGYLVPKFVRERPGSAAKDPI